MKRVFSSPDSAKVGLVQSLLESADIPCEMRNEAISQVMPGTPFISEVWILKDEDADRAQSLVDSVQ